MVCSRTLLDGYQASVEFMEHLAETLPLYRALPGVGAARWLDEHGYRDVEWAIAAVRQLAQVGRARSHTPP